MMDFLYYTLYLGISVAVGIPIYIAIKSKQNILYKFETKISLEWCDLRWSSHNEKPNNIIIYEYKLRVCSIIVKCSVHVYSHKYICAMYLS